jgi:hypothetical protein
MRIHVPARGGCDVYLMEGELIATSCVTDANTLIDRMLARGRVDASTVNKVRAKSEGTVLSVDVLRKFTDEALIGRLMSGRFRDNLVFHLFDAGRFDFRPMNTIMMPHLQIGHDSAGLLRELEVVHQQISPWLELLRERVMTWGSHTPSTPQQRHIQALCTSGLRLDRLLTSSPFFPTQTLVLVAQMIENGSLIAAEVDSGLGPDPGSVSHAIKQAAAEKERRRDVQRDRDAQGLKVAPITGANDLAAFADHEVKQRGLGLGEFSGGQTQKDRVDLSTPLRRKPGLRFGSPLLSSQDIARKVGVCNEVLTAMVEVWDDQHGTGQGQRMAQLIIDAAPMDFAHLFRKVLVDTAGRMGASDILKNVERRPEGERRNLVNKGLSDLIERSLGRSIEGLDENHLDQMLQRVVGYRQRLGL